MYKKGKTLASNKKIKLLVKREGLFFMSLI